MTVVASRIRRPSCVKGIGGPACMPSARGEVAASGTTSSCAGPAGMPTTAVSRSPAETPSISTRSVTAQGIAFCTRRRSSPRFAQCHAPEAGVNTMRECAVGAKT